MDIIVKNWFHCGWFYNFIFVQKQLQISTINPIINVSKGQLHRSCYWRLKRPNITPLHELLNYIKFSSVTQMHLISYENNKKKRKYTWLSQPDNYGHYSVYLLAQTPVTKNKIYDRHQSIRDILSASTDRRTNNLYKHHFNTYIITTSVLQQEQKQEKQQKNKNTYNFIIIVANLLKDLIHLYKWRTTATCFTYDMYNIDNRHVCNTNNNNITQWMNNIMIANLYFIVVCPYYIRDCLENLFFDGKDYVLRIDFTNFLVLKSWMTKFHEQKLIDLKQLY